jgi:hypothetical protein
VATAWAAAVVDDGATERIAAADAGLTVDVLRSSPALPADRNNDAPRGAVDAWSWLAAVRAKPPIDAIARPRAGWYDDRLAVVAGVVALVAADAAAAAGAAPGAIARWFASRRTGARLAGGVVVAAGAGADGCVVAAAAAGCTAPAAAGRRRTTAGSA